MSRSNPTESSSHPCTRWHEYDGANGNVRYYDRDSKTNVPVADGFRFILLDELAVVKGWHDASDSGITSNEVKRIDRDPITVKAFKGGVLAEGLYSKIRDRVVNLGGHYTANLYIAFKPDSGALAIGSLQLKGAALGAWMEFAKKNRGEIYKKSIVIRGSNEGKKGKVVFKTPIFHLTDISPETDAQAMALDKALQEYLTGYFGKSKITPPSAEDADPPSRGDEPEDTRDFDSATPAEEPEDSDFVPF